MKRLKYIINKISDVELELKNQRRGYKNARTETFGIRVMGTYSNVTESSVIRILELENELEYYTGILDDFYSRLTPLEYQVIAGLLLGKSRVCIGNELYYSSDYIYKIQNRAICKLYN